MVRWKNKETRLRWKSKMEINKSPDAVPCSSHHLVAKRLHVKHSLYGRGVAMVSHGEVKVCFRMKHCNYGKPVEERCYECEDGDTARVTGQPGEDNMPSS